MSSVSSKGKEGERSTVDLAAALPPAVGQLDKDIKAPIPEMYDGKRADLKRFMIQMDLFLTFQKGKFHSETEKVLYAVSRLEGEALKWIEGFAVDFMEKTNDKGNIMTTMMEDTKTYFRTYAGFKKGLATTFGELDEERQAERALLAIRQKGSCTKYTAEFNRHVTKVSWGDSALRTQYYRGLKDSVKDDLIKEDKPETLKEQQDLAVKIDNRNYERSLERKGYYDQSFKRDKNSSKGQGRSEHYDPMELDVTERQELSPQEKERRKQEKLCFACGKAGHMSRNCKTSGRPKKQFGRRNQLNATTQEGYNGPMQLHATLQGPLDDIKDADQEEGASHADQIEEPQGLSQFERRFYEHLGTTPEQQQDAERATDRKATPEPEDQSDDETLSEISQDELYQIQILSGQRTAKDIGEELAQRYCEFVDKEFPEHGENPRTNREKAAKLRLIKKEIADYQLHLLLLERTIERQLAETTAASLENGAQEMRYREILTDNVDYLDNIITRRTELSEIKKQISEKIQHHQEVDNVARIDHPRHAELTWSACYTSSCLIHYDGKINGDYFPSWKKPIYWDTEPTPGTSVATESSSWSKN